MNSDETQSCNTEQTCESIRRPLGVTVIAVFGLLAGATTVINSCQLVLDLLATYREASGPVRFSSAFLIVHSVEIVLAFIAIGSFLGMLLGRKWGWFCGGIFWVWRASREIVRLGIALYAAVPLSEAGSGIGMRIVLATGLLIYLFSFRVRNYFNLPADEWARDAAITGFTGTASAVVCQLAIAFEQMPL
jgi:hypothetical protein